VVPVGLYTLLDDAARWMLAKWHGKAAPVGAPARSRWRED
jgi:hypothetical protein